MSERIRYGMVGGGINAFIGDVHRKAISFDPRAQLVAGCFSTNPDINAQTGDMLYVDPSRVYASYREMAEKESEREDGIRFVSITVPNNAHYDIARCFVEHGINVVCEKPLCFTVQQAEALCVLAKQRNVLFGVMYAYSGYTMVKVMKEMIENGKIGEVIAVNAEYPQEWLIDELGENSSDTAKLSGWRSDPAVAGISNCTGDIGSHIENTVYYLTGLKIKRLLATANTFGKELDLNANILVEYENGANGAYWCSQVAAGNHNGLAVRIYGTQGGIEWAQHFPDYVRYTPKGRPTETLARGTGYLEEAAAGYSRIPSGHPEGLFVGFANVYKNYINAVAKQQKGEALTDQDLDFPNEQDGLLGVKFIHAVIESAKRDAGWVTL